MGVFRRIWALGNRSKLEREIEDELREHMRMRIDAEHCQGHERRRRLCARRGCALAILLW